jgi:quercetin dioxygenase-like cupin family protein
MQSLRPEPIAVGALRIQFLVQPEEVDRSVSVFECTVPSGSKMAAPHSHDAFDETIYQLEGTSTWTVDGDRTELAPGEALCVRRGAIHGFDNEGEGTARFLAIATPGVFGPSYFQEIGAVLASAGPPDMSEVAAVMRRHGLTPAPPR